MFKFLDKIIYLFLFCIFLCVAYVYGFVKIKQKKNVRKSKNKTILFICSGAPFVYPKSKNNDINFRKKWNSGFGTQLLHPTFDSSYALYLSDNNTSYKLCPSIISIVIKAINYTLFPRISNFINMIKLILVAKYLNKKINFYTVETFFPGDMVLHATCISMILNLPLVMQCQGDFDLSYFDENFDKETIKKLINRNIQKVIFSFVLRRAKLVLGYNDHCASFTICSGASPHKVRRCRIHSFIEDFENIPLLPKQAILDFPETYKVVFLWSRLAPEKKLKYAFAAMKKLLFANSKIKLLIAGDGPLKEYFKEYLIDIRDQVVFLGNLERSVLKSYIYYSDVSLTPLAGHSIIESGMCKKAVIGFNWEWHGEVITNNESGILVDYPNINAFSDAVIYAINNPEHMRIMGEKLYNRVKKIFNEESVNRRQKEIWNEFHASMSGVI